MTDQQQFDSAAEAAPLHGGQAEPAAMATRELAPLLAPRVAVAGTLSRARRDRGDDPVANSTSDSRQPRRTVGPCFQAANSSGELVRGSRRRSWRLPGARVGPRAALVRLKGRPGSLPSSSGWCRLRGTGPEATMEGARAATPGRAASPGPGRDLRRWGTSVWPWKRPSRSLGLAVRRSPLTTGWPVACSVLGLLPETYRRPVSAGSGASRC